MPLTPQRHLCPSWVARYLRNPEGFSHYPCPFSVWLQKATAYGIETLLWEAG